MSKKYRKGTLLKPLAKRRASNDYYLKNLEKVEVTQHYTGSDNDFNLQIKIIEGNAKRWGTMHNKGAVLRVAAAAFEPLYTNNDKLHYPIF